MTREQQKQRRDEVIRLVKTGMQAIEIAKRFNLRVQSIYEMCKYEGIKFKDYVKIKRNNVITVDYSRGEVNCCPKCRKTYGYAYNGAIDKY